MSDDMQAHYQNLGYRVASDGAVEFYYLTLATKGGSPIPGICVNGLFSWSNHNHDPAVTIRSLPKKQGEYALNRIGPFPHRSDCEMKAMDLAHQYHHNPSAYGIFGTGGLHEIADADYRDPRFR